MIHDTQSGPVLEDDLLFKQLGNSDINLQSSNFPMATIVFAYKSISYQIQSVQIAPVS